MASTAATGFRATLPRLSLRKIACFVAAADAGSVSAAARQLAMSQASVSEALIDLEREIGAGLFLRHKARGVSLTNVGHQLLAEARDLIHRAENFEVLAREPACDLTGEVVVGCFPTLLPFVGPILFCGLRPRHPGISLRFVEDAQPALEEALLAGTIDVSILYDVDIIPGLSRRHLFDARPFVLLSKDHHLASAKGPIDLAELVDDPFIQMDVIPGKNDFVFSCAGITPHPVHRTTNFELVRSLVGRNVGYAVLVQRPMSNMTYEGLPLVIRPIANPIPALRVIFAWPTHTHLHRRVRTLLDFAEKLLQRDGYPSVKTGSS